MGRADRVELRPHDMGGQRLRASVIDHEVHTHIVDLTDEVPDLKDDVALAALLPDDIRLDEPGPPLFPVVIPDGQEAAPTRSSAVINLPDASNKSSSFRRWVMELSQETTTSNCRRWWA